MVVWRVLPLIACAGVVFAMLSLGGEGAVAGECACEDATFLMDGLSEAPEYPAMAKAAPPAGDEAGLELPGNDSAMGILSVGASVTAPAWIPCSAGVSDCTGGWTLNVGRAFTRYISSSSASADVVSYFGYDQGCDWGKEVGPLARNNGSAFLDVYLGSDWRLDETAYNGGQTTVQMWVYEFNGSACAGSYTRFFNTDQSTCNFPRTAKSWQEPRGDGAWSTCGSDGEKGVCGCNLVDRRISAPSVAGTYSYKYLPTAYVKDFEGNTLSSDNQYGCFSVTWTDSTPGDAVAAPFQDEIPIPCWASEDQCNGDYKLPIGLGSVMFVEVPPDPCAVDLSPVAFYSAGYCGYGSNAGTVTANRSVILYMPSTYAIRHVPSVSSCTGYSRVKYDVVEYLSSDCSGSSTGRSWTNADVATSAGLSAGSSKEARADRGAYCDGQYGDTTDAWHLPDSFITKPSGNGTYSYKTTICAQYSTPGGPLWNEDCEEGCFNLFWAP